MELTVERTRHASSQCKERILVYTVMTAIIPILVSLSDQFCPVQRFVEAFR